MKSQLDLAMAYGSSAERVMKLQANAGQMKIRKSEFSEFVNVADKASKVLGITAEQSSQMNYQMSRIPGFVGHYDQIASAAKRVAQQFNVKPEELLASFDSSNPDVARILLSIPEDLKTGAGEIGREVAMKQLMAIEGSMKQMGRAGAEVRAAFVQIMSPDNEQGNLLVSRMAQVGGKSVEAIRAQIKNADLTETYGDFLRLIESMSAQQVSELGDTWAKASGLSADALSVLRLQLDREKTATMAGSAAMLKAIGEVSSASNEMGKPAKTLDDYWSSIETKVSVMAGKLENTFRTDMLQKIEKAFGGFAADAAKLVNDFLPKMVDMMSGVDVVLEDIKEGIKDVRGLFHELDRWKGAATEVFTLGFADTSFNQDKEAVEKTYQQIDAMKQRQAAMEPMLQRYEAKKGQFDQFYKLYKDYYKTGQMTKEEILGQLNALGLTKEEIKEQYSITDLAAGGLVRPRAGGKLANIGEGGEAEAVIPLSQMGAMVEVNQDEVVAAIKWLGGIMVQLMASRGGGTNYASVGGGLSSAEKNFLNYRG
jgi:uncharacterized protein YidB (DUF937 family)